MHIRYEVPPTRRSNHHNPHSRKRRLHRSCRGRRRWFYQTPHSRWIVSGKCAGRDAQRSVAAIKRFALRKKAGGGPTKRLIKSTAPVRNAGQSRRIVTTKLNRGEKGWEGCSQQRSRVDGEEYWRCFCCQVLQHKRHPPTRCGNTQPFKSTSPGTHRKL